MCFNSRARKGRDVSMMPFYAAILVSIHAPVKGAMQPLDNHAPKLHVSIHAPVKGAICLPCQQSTAGSGFNSRARKGRD